jgi:acyl carrier protein phosphodiesterase
MVGGFLGDFVKGRLVGQYEGKILSGLRLHRSIDAFTDHHPVVKQSHQRFTKEFRRYAPIICDIAYDHFLARNWSTYNEIPLHEFASFCYQTVLKAELPINARNTMSRYEEHKVLESYDETAFVSRALVSISARLKRDNPLDRAFGDFEDIKEDLALDFELFMPSVLSFTKTWLIEEID